MTLTIVPLSELPSGSLDDMVGECEQSGFRFLRRLVDDWNAGVNRFERPQEVLLAAMCGSQIVGVCGLNIDPYLNEENAGRVRHLYVLAAYRGRGIGRRLVGEVIARARRHFDRLRLRTDSLQAARFYEHLGFRWCLAVPHCTHTLDLSSAR